MDSDPYTLSSVTKSGHVKYMATPFFVTICDVQIWPCNCNPYRAAYLLKYTLVTNVART